jgi:hypothetical protein
MADRLSRLVQRGPWYVRPMSQAAVGADVLLGATLDLAGGLDDGD